MVKKWACDASHSPVAANRLLEQLAARRASLCSGDHSGLDRWVSWLPVKFCQHASDDLGGQFAILNDVCRVLPLTGNLS